MAGPPSAGSSARTRSGRVVGRCFTPGAQPGQHRDQLDGRLGQAIGCPLTRPRIVAGEQARVGQALEPVSQDVGGNTFLRPGRQFPEMPPART